MIAITHLLYHSIAKATRGQNSVTGHFFDATYKAFLYGFQVIGSNCRHCTKCDVGAKFFKGVESSELHELIRPKLHMSTM